MIFLLDNISSTMVYGVLAFLLATMQLRLQQSAMEQTIEYMSKKQTLEFADMLERDIKSIGSGVEGDMIDTITTSDLTDLTTAFSYNTTALDGTPLEVAYTLEEYDTVVTGATSVKRYQLKRYENGKLVGGSPSTLRSFRIELLNDGGSPATASSARLVRVSFVNAYPIGSGSNMSIRQTYWASTLRPINLAS